MQRIALDKAEAGLLSHYSLEGCRGPMTICYEKGEFICREGDLLECLLFQLTGRIKISVTADNGKTLLYCFYEPGSLIGGLELMCGRIATANAEAVTQVRCLAVPIEQNMVYFKNNIGFLNHLCEDLSRNFIRSSQNSAINILHTLDTRLCAYISMTQENGRFYDKLTHVSELLGVSYRHLLRALHALCERGLLERKAGYYAIADPIALKRLARDHYTL